MQDTTVWLLKGLAHNLFADITVGPRYYCGTQKSILRRKCMILAQYTSYAVCAIHINLNIISYWLAINVAIYSLGWYIAIVQAHVTSMINISQLGKLLRQVLVSPLIRSTLIFLFTWYAIPYMVRSHLSVRKHYINNMQCAIQVFTICYESQYINI